MDVTIVIRKPFDQVVVKAHPVGNHIEPVIRLKRDEKGNKIYQKDGEIDVRKDIQSYANGCSLAAQLTRMQYVPIREKVSMLQQTDVGVSADLSDMPTDGTAAWILIKDQMMKHPGVFERLSAGESFEVVMRDTFLPKDNKENNVEGVINDGKNE